VIRPQQTDVIQAVPETQAFSVSTESKDGFTILSVAGELDRATAPELEEALAACNGNGPVIVDVTALAFIDSGGLHVLLRKRESGTPAAIVVERDSHVARVFDIVAAGTRVFLCHDLKTAMKGSGKARSLAIRPSAVT
jgi:anti-anti-sigma factor